MSKPASEQKQKTEEREGDYGQTRYQDVNAQGEGLGLGEFQR